MDLTQRLMSEEEDGPLDKTKPSALLHVFKGPYGPAQDIDVYPGQNVIGRHANCDITLPSQSVSKKHAILDVRPYDHLLHDCGSLNKTRRGKVPFTPHVRYALNTGDFLHFADVACQYTILLDPVKTPEKKPASEENEDDSFVVPGTQAALAIEKTPGVVIRSMAQRAVLAKDSGDEDEEEKVRRPSDEWKGFGSPGVDHRTMTTGAFLSPATDTIVPESDEENDTPKSECRFASHRLRRYSGTDRPAMSTKREPLVVSSQSFVTSPTLSEKKTPMATDPGPSRGGGNVASVPAGIEEKTLLDDKEDPTTAKKENGSESGSSIIKPASGEKDETSKETSIKSPKNEKDAGTEPSGEKGDVATAVSDSNVDVKDDLSASEIDPEETESPRIVQESSDSEVSEHEVETKSTFFDVRSDTENEDDARASGTGTSTGKTPEIKAHGDSKSREGDASGKIVEGEVKAAFHMDSDTDVEDESTSSVKEGARKRKPTAILSDSDDEAGAVKSTGSTNVKRTSGVISDSDTDVEEEVIASVKATRRKRHVARVTSDSDTDVEDGRKTGTAPGSGTDAGENEKSTLKAGAKKERVELNINSDTDAEDGIGITVSAKSGSISQKTDNSLLGGSEKPTTSACVNAGSGEDPKTGGTKIEDAIGFHMDSDTDTEECATESPAAGNGTCVQTANLDVNAALEVHGETSEASDHDQNGGPSVKGLEAVAEFHMDSDTDVEDNNTLSPVSVKGGHSSADGDHPASTGGLEVNMDAAGTKLATDTSVVVEEQKDVTEEMAARGEITVPEKAKKSEPEGTDYYMCETQCFLDEPEERDSDLPDDAEEATQAFISSTWIDPDPFKRPADPILQISPVRVNTSEEDENVTAETQPYFCETETPLEECTQESVQAECESSESSSDTQPLSHHETSQDTQPVSQYLAAKPAHETAARVSLKREVPDGLRAGGAQLKEDVEDGEEVSADEVATLAYTLAVQDSDGEATQAFLTADDANEPECNESPPGSLSAPENSSATDGQTSEEDRVHPRGVPASVGDQTEVVSTEAADRWQIRDDEEQEEASCSTSTPAVKVDDTQDESVQLRLSPSFVLTGQEAGDLRCSPPEVNPERTHEGNESEEGGKRQEEITDVAESETQNTSREDEDGDTVCRRESQDNVDVDPEPSALGVSGGRWRTSSATQEVEDGKDITTSEAPRFKTGPDLSLNIEQSDERGNNDSAVQDICTADDPQEDVNDKISKEKDFKVDLMEPKEEEEMEETSSLSLNGMQSKTTAEPTESVDQESEDVASFVAPNAEKEVKLEDKTPEKLTSRAALRPTRAKKEAAPEETPEPSGNLSSTRKTKSIKKEIESNQEQQKSRKSDGDSVRRVVSRRTKNNLTGEGVSEQKDDDDEKPEEVPVKRPVSRRTRQNATGEQNESKEKPEEVQVGRPSLRRTRKNSTERPSELKEEPVSRPSLRRTRKTSTESGTSEQKEEPVSRPSVRRTRKTSTEGGTSELKEEPVCRSSVRRTRKTSTESGTSVEKLDNPVSSKVSSRTRNSSALEGTLIEKEDNDGLKENQVSRAVSRRTRKTAEEGSNVQKKDLGKPEEGPARPVSRRGRKNSVEGTNVEKEDKEKSEEGAVSRPVSRRTRKNPEDKAEHEADVQTSEIEVEKQTACTQATKTETGVPIRQAVRTRRNLKGVEEPELGDPSQKLEEGDSTLESDGKQDDKPGKQTSLRGQKKRLNEASQAEPKVNARSRKATARTEDVAGGETATTNKELKGESPKGDLTKCPQVSTPPQTRKRGQGQKDSGVEVKRKKPEEGTKTEGGAEKTSPNSSGKKIQPRLLVAASAEEDDTKGGSEKRKESLSPIPVPAGRGRQKQNAASSSPAEARTARRTCRSLVPPGASNPYVPHLGSAPKILFTGVVDSAGEEAIRSLGGDIADSVYDCTHLVTDRVRRTVKFLCALARGVPIVTLDWIEKCKKSGCFLSPDGFLVKDKEQEKSFGFVLSKSLQQAKRKALFEGYEIHVTPNVKPIPEEMKDVIQCCGATFLPRMPRTHKEKCVIVSCPEDSARWRGVPSSVPITSAEFILSGILRQVVSPDVYLLDADSKDAKPTPAKRRR